MPIGRNLARLLTALFVLTSAWVTLAPASQAQTREPPPIMMNMPEALSITLENGSMLGLSELMNGGYPPFSMSVGGGKNVFPVRFESVVLRDGELVARDSRTGVIWPDSDEVSICPADAWGYLASLYEVSEDGQLPPGAYEVRLSLASERGETLVEPFVIRIDVPEE